MNLCIYNTSSDTTSMHGYHKYQHWHITSLHSILLQATFEFIATNINTLEVLIVIPQKHFASLKRCSRTKEYLRKTADFPLWCQIIAQNSRDQIHQQNAKPYPFHLVTINPRGNTFVTHDAFITYCACAGFINTTYFDKYRYWT